MGHREAKPQHSHHFLKLPVVPDVVKINKSWISPCWLVGHWGSAVISVDGLFTLHGRQCSTAPLLYQHILNLLPTQHISISTRLPCLIISNFTISTNSRSADWCSLVNPLLPFPVGKALLGPLFLPPCPLCVPCTGEWGAGNTLHSLCVFP